MAIVTTIDGVSQDDVVNLASLVLVESAEGGEIGQGGFDRADYALGNVPALKLVTIVDADATPTRLFTGRTGIRGLGRGNERGGDRRQWDVNLWDVNFLLDTQIFESADGANRPAETDFARISWLLTTSAFSALGIVAGVVPNTNTVNLDATDYRGAAGGPRRVLSDCGEAAQKNYFLYVFDPVDDIQLYYDKHTGTALTSTLSLSTDPADVDDVSCFALELGASLESDPSNIWSTVRFNYTGGHVRRDDSDAGVTTSADFMARETVVEDSTVKSAAKATSKADAYLRAASTEKHRFRCEVVLPPEFVNEIRGGMRVAVKAPHLSTADFDFSDFVFFRITRRELRPQPTEHDASRDWYRLTLEFADDVKITSFNNPRPPGDVDSTALDDGSALAFTRYQLADETGGGPFGPAAGLWYTVSPAFSFGSLSSPTPGQVQERPEHNVPYPYTDCGVGTGAVAGLEHEESFFRFQIDLSDETIVGVRITVDDLSATDVGFATTDGLIVGVHTGASSTGAELTDRDQYVPCGTVPITGGDVFIPVSLLIDDGAGYCWIVLAPNWRVSSGLLICNSAGAKPEGYVETGTNTSQKVHGVEVTASGSGLSAWLPALGDVDGSNVDFELPLWSGEGTPQIRVGSTILIAGEFTVDSSTLTATLVVAPPADMAGQVFYRARMSS